MKKVKVFIDQDTNELKVKEWTGDENLLDSYVGPRVIAEKTFGVGPLASAATGGYETIPWKEGYGPDNCLMTHFTIENSKELIPTLYGNLGSIAPKPKTGRPVGGVGFVVSETVTLGNDSLFTVDAVDANGAITELSVTSSFNAPYNIGITRTNNWVGNLAGNSLDFIIKVDVDGLTILNVEVVLSDSSQGFFTGTMTVDENGGGNSIQKYDIDVTGNAIVSIIASRVDKC